MELKGRVVQLLPLQSGMGKKGQWRDSKSVPKESLSFYLGR